MQVNQILDETHKAHMINNNNNNNNKNSMIKCNSNKMNRHKEL